MKQLYFTLIVGLLFGISSQSFAQCTPNTSLVGTGVHYNKSVPFCLNTAYNQVFQLVVTNDTVIKFGNITIPASIDSAKLTNVANMPVGLSYECPTANCLIVNSGGNYSHNCMVVSGTPGIAGNYNIIFSFRLFSGGASINYDVALPVTVEETCIVGIEALNSRKSIDIYPQPSSSEANVEINLNTASNVTVTIHDLLGQEVSRAYRGNLGSGTNQVNISESVKKLKSGIYLVNTQINSSGKTENYTKRLVVE